MPVGAFKEGLIQVLLRWRMEVMAEYALLQAFSVIVLAKALMKSPVFRRPTDLSTSWTIPGRVGY